MDEADHLRTQALLLIVAKTVGELDLEELLKCIDLAEAGEAWALSVCQRTPHDLTTLRRIVSGAIQFQKALPGKGRDR